ncbi:class I SAM-dependent methyltransferase [Telmatospirillum siberiense]|uniref:Methyltransferase type 11 domain-containing protein n=1 Tax=Telmatospirillum siberiense TaxID=382514 RepID=A0A2N3PV83_9PROT|nr:class I SAM-dependent methyltransferase [Telmatospirillum siberiense]PKU24309.1 hypothetical protein CWS72_11985 [Telmatospirillum siberiense]
MTDPAPPPPRPGENSVRRYFDARADVYRQAAGRGLWAWERRREASAVFALCGEVAGLSALDLGCGAGFYAERLARLGARPVVAVDASERMLKQITDPRIVPRQGDAATVELGLRFERIILAGVLEFVAHPQAVLCNARRHLAEDGRIVALLPPDNAAGRLYQAFHRSHGLDITLFDRRRIDTLISDAGLRSRNDRFVRPMAVVCALEAR